MIITDKFIMIHFPKTGSTFAMQVLDKLHRNENSRLHNLLVRMGMRNQCSYENLMLKQTEFVSQDNPPFHQHGRWEQIPEQYKSMPVVSIVREPVNRNISNYEFRWWAKHPVARPEEIYKRFPNFPDLDFVEYLAYQNFNTHYRDTGVVIPGDIGNQTVQFFQFFSRNPKKSFKMLNDHYIYDDIYREDMPDLTLLKTETINRDLYEFLLANNYREQDIKFILKEERIRPRKTGRLDDESRKNYLTEAIIEDIKLKERYLYKIYSDYGIDYTDCYTG